MRATYDAEPLTHDQACRILEALCEGYVLAMMEEFDAEPEGSFPCCIKCGHFRTRNAPLTPAQAQSVIETLEHGHPVSGLQRHHLAGILKAHGVEAPERNDHPPGNWGTVAVGHEAGVSRMAPGDLAIGEPVDYGRPMRGFAARPGAVRVHSAREILRNKGGHTVELACYQAAMKRRGGADPGAKVIICCTQPGTFRGAVLMSHEHSNEAKRGRIDDPVVDARPVGSCGCGVPSEEG